jgi:ComF family protein
MGVKSFLVNIKDDFLDMLYPDDAVCVVCGDELGGDAVRGFCAECYKNLPFNAGKVCLCCGAVIGDAADYCNRCQAREEPYAFRKARSAFVYEGAVPPLVHGFKFGRRKYLAGHLAAFMTDALLAAGFPYDIIVPVPLHPKTQKERGFNQAEELGRRVALHMNNGKPCRAGLLVKTKATPEQARLAGASRAENLEGTFALHNKSEIQDKTILLVDDVFTTGATANECARTLKKAGAKEVYVLSLASTKSKPAFE